MIRSLSIPLVITLLLKIVTVIPAMILATIIDGVSLTDRPPYTLLGLFFLLTGIQALLVPIHSWCLARLCQDHVRSLSVRWCSNLLAKQFEVYDQLHGGALVKVLDRGITAQERWLNFLIGSAWPVLAEALVLGALFFYLGAGALLLALVPLSFTYLLINGLLVAWRRPHIDAINAQEDVLAKQWVDTFASAAVIKLELAEAAAMRPVKHTLGVYADAAVRLATSAGCLQAVRILFLGLGSGGLLAWGVHDQARSTPSLSLGELVALFTLTAGLLAGIAHLAETWRMLDQFKADLHKLECWLRLPNFGLSSDEPRNRPSAKIDHDGLCLTPCVLQNGDQRLVVKTTLIAQPKERLAIIGPSGSGKSTLLHALAGTLQPLREHLFLKGQAVSRMAAREQLSCLRLCPQESRFVPGPLPQSVLLEQHHDKQHVEHLLERLGLNTCWYERKIDERGGNISGGEAKRLSLLRILNQPGDFNLFDEPTSGLDAQLSAQTWDLLFEALEGRGMICVTHDQAALGRFDRVIRMDGGQIASVQSTSPGPM